MSSADVPADRSVIELARLLEHPAIWRGRSAARAETVPTGFSALDASLPGRGWPRVGLIEILVSRFGVGEQYLLLPALAALTGGPAARWCAWVSPPLEPYAPALAAHGLDLGHVLVIRSGGSLWAYEQALGSGACDAALAWAPARVSSPLGILTERVARESPAGTSLAARSQPARASQPAKARRPHARELRRLQLAAERGRTLGVLFRPRSAARESSPATLRLVVEPGAGQVGQKNMSVRVTLLKSRGGARGSIDLAW